MSSKKSTLISVGVAFVCCILIIVLAIVIYIYTRPSKSPSPTGSSTGRSTGGSTGGSTSPFTSPGSTNTRSPSSLLTCGTEILRRVEAELPFVDSTLFDECYGLPNEEFSYGYADNIFTFGLQRTNQVYTTDTRGTHGINAARYIREHFRLPSPSPPASTRSSTSPITSLTLVPMGGICSISAECDGNTTHGGQDFGARCWNGICRDVTFGMNVGDTCADGQGGYNNCWNGLYCESSAYYTCQNPSGSEPNNDPGYIDNSGQPTGGFASD